MELRNVLLSDLKANPAQPDNRTNKVSDLVSSIQAFGLMTPLTVDEKTMEIIDGHRRVAALLQLGFTHAFAFIYNGELAAKNLTSVEAMSICNTSKRLSTQNHLHIYMNGGMVSGALANNLIQLTSIYGKQFIGYIQSRNLSPRTVIQYGRLAKLINYSDINNFKKFIAWSQFHKCSIELNFLDRLRIRRLLSDNLILRLKESFEKNEKLILQIK